MSKSIIYGAHAEQEFKWELHNSFVTMNLGDGLWVNVPNIVAPVKNRLRPLYKFGLDPNTEPTTVRIVANHITRRGKVCPEPTDFRRTEWFEPEAGMELDHHEYPNVLVRTFSILGLGLGTVEALIEEQYKAIEDGWLCHVTDTPRDIMPGKLAVSAASLVTY